MIKILLQTTIPATDDDWSIHRYSLLRDYLASLRDERDEPLFAVTARDREPDASGHDPVLSGLADSDFDEIWLFAADIGNGLSGRDCAGISAFRQRGGGILATRDHQDAGSSICSLGGVGAAHYFHTRNQDPDPSRCCVDDTQTATISWPNYHSGRNGDYQQVIRLPTRGKADLILIHNMGSTCPNCTLWADGLNGIYHHLADRAAVVVTSPDPPEVQQRFAQSRGWKFPMVSHQGTSFAADMGYRSKSGGWLPGISVFKRDGKRILRVSDATFEPGDDFCALWHILDLLPGGAGDWAPKFSYS